MLRKLSTILAVLVVAVALYFALKPKTQTRHPEFGQDCVDLADKADLGRVDCVRVFYGTNRNILGESNSDIGDISGAGGQNSETLSLGRADIWLPTLGSGSTQRDRGETPLAKGKLPDDPNALSEYVFITRITTSGRERFSSDLQTAIEEDYSDGVFVFIHGFNVQFDQALIRTAQLSVDLSDSGGFDIGVPVLYSWPSAGKISAYKSDQDRASASAPYLREFFTILLSDLDIERINIIAHSMGNRLLTATLEDMVEDVIAEQGRDEIEFRIIFSAADVDEAVFADTVGVLDQIDANVIIYTSDTDRALQVSRKVNKNKRLGDTLINRPYIRDNSRFTTIDATDVSTEMFGLGHSYYATQPSVIGDMRCALQDYAASNRALDVRHYEGDETNPVYYRTNTKRANIYSECGLIRTQLPWAYIDDENINAPPVAPPPPPVSAPPPDVQLSVDISDIDLEYFPGAELRTDLYTGLSQGRIENIVISIFDTEPSSVTAAERIKDYLLAQGVSENLVTITSDGRASNEDEVLISFSYGPG